MTIKNPLSGPDPNEVSKFAESVNKGVIPFSKNITETAKKTRESVGGIISDVGVGAVTLPPELALNVAGWGAGAITGLAYRGAHAVHRTRQGIRSILTGKKSGDSSSSALVA